MNIKGAVRGGEILKTYLKPNIFLTNIRVQDFNYNMTDVVQYVFYTFGFNMKLYGIMNKENLLAICTQIENMVKVTYAGAVGGYYAKLITTTTHRQESVYIDPRNNTNGGRDLNYIPDKARTGLIGRMWGKLTGGSSPSGELSDDGMI
jgi:hypothetical protein